MGTPKFGVGFIGLIPAGANPTPIPFGVVKSAAVEHSREIKFLRGQNPYPVDAAAGYANTKGTVKFASFGSATLAAVLAGSTSATGSKVGIANETITSASTGVAVANGATFFEDMGLIDTTTGLAMVRVASAPAAGQYSLNTTTGTYTGAVADNGHALLASYSYTGAAIGKTVTLLNNQVIGPATIFTLGFYQTYGATRRSGVRFPAVVIPKLGLDYKVDDWADASAEFEVLQDAAGNVMTHFEMD